MIGRPIAIGGGGIAPPFERWRENAVLLKKIGVFLIKIPTFGTKNIESHVLIAKLGHVPDCNHIAAKTKMDKSRRC